MGSVNDMILSDLLNKKTLLESQLENEGKLSIKISFSSGIYTNPEELQKYIAQLTNLLGDKSRKILSGAMSDLVKGDNYLFK
ncbi:Uncharacterised protein [Candidatus Tiddalikarchaeum anstoanum]|nr:Uncharacterised protein [Candidatus Tiddalikarchaeum anstoanum]